MIEVTERAMKKLRETLKGQQTPTLRLFVEGFG